MIGRFGWIGLRVLAGVLALGMVLFSVLDVCARITYGRVPSTIHTSQGLNGLWASHQWVGDPHTASEFEEFAGLLSEGEISDVFIHVGPLEADGTIPLDRYAHAVELVDALHQRVPGVRVQAWIGQLELRGGGILDLSDPAVRDQIIDTATVFLDLGFDGIHYDIEPIYPDDRHWLDLLQRTGEMTGDRRAVLSVAMEELEPFPGFGAVAGFFLPRLHPGTKDYYQQVADRVDQMAIMTYDTSLPYDYLYGSFVRHETRFLVDLLADEVTVFIGVPTYDYDNIGFHPRAENIESALRGIQQGLARYTAAEIRNVGVALYAEWTTEPAEWDVYRRRWLEGGW